jgi:hypothetical protein
MAVGRDADVVVAGGDVAHTGVGHGGDEVVDRLPPTGGDFRLWEDDPDLHLMSLTE